MAPGAAALLGLQLWSSRAPPGCTRRCSWLFVLRMRDQMKTELVSAIHLQEVELQEKASERQSRWFDPQPLPAAGAWRWHLRSSFSGPAVLQR